MYVYIYLKKLKKRTASVTTDRHDFKICYLHIDDSLIENLASALNTLRCVAMFFFPSGTKRKSTWRKFYNIFMLFFFRVFLDIEDSKIMGRNSE